MPSVRAARTPPQRPGPALQPYERHVYDLAATRAAPAGGEVPVAALRLDSGDQAKDWQHRFRELLNADGRRRGLVRDRAPRWARTLFRLALLLPFGLTCLYAHQTHNPEAAVFTAFVLLGVGIRLSGLRQPVPSGSGEAIAARCRALRSTAALPERRTVPEIARTGDRRSAYTTAVSRSRIAGGPFDALTGKDSVWSAATGAWRQVKVVDRAPRGTLRAPAGPPLTGHRYVQAVPRPDPSIANAGLAVFAGSWAILLTMATRVVVSDPRHSPRATLFIGIGWPLWILGVYAFTRSRQRQRADRVAPPVTLIGPIVYLKSFTDTKSPDTFFVGVDDGTADRVVRHAIERDLHDSLRLGMRLRLDLTASGDTVIAAQILPESPAVSS